MRDFIRYLLALTVLVGGFYGATKYKRTQRTSNPNQTESSQQSIAFAQADTAAVSGDTASQPPLAALIDTERDLIDKLQAEVEPMLQTLPSIARNGTSERPAWDEGVADSEVEDLDPIPTNDPVRQDLSSANDSDKPKSPPKNASKKRDKAKKPAPIATDFAKSPEAQSWKSGNPRRELEESGYSDTDDVAHESSRKAGRLSTEQVNSVDSTPDSETEADDPFAGITAYNPFAFLEDRAAEAVDRGKSDTPEQSTESVNRPKSPFRIVESGVVPNEPDTQWETHRIEIGDTLPLLASRYLGDSTRYTEIYQANRKLLSDPRLLPIGVEIRIPVIATDDDSAKTTETPASRWWNDPDPLADPQGHAENLASSDEGSYLETDMEPIPPEALPPPGQTPWSTWGR